MFTGFARGCVGGVGLRFTRGVKVKTTYFAPRIVNRNLTIGVICVLIKSTSKRRINIIKKTRSKLIKLKEKFMEKEEILKKLYEVRDEMEGNFMEGRGEIYSAGYLDAVDYAVSLLKDVVEF
jgi:hypothetical protein